MESTEDDKGIGRVQRLLRVYKESADMYGESAEHDKSMGRVLEDKKGVGRVCRLIRVWGECMDNDKGTGIVWRMIRL